MNKKNCKACKACKELKPLTEFYKHETNSDGLFSFCKTCQREKDLTRERTKVGLISRMYATQKERSKNRGYALPIYTRRDLQDWLFSQDIFHCIYDKWVVSGYKTELRPSCDRLDDYKSYAFENLRVTTWGENDKKAREDRRNGVNNKDSKAVFQLTPEGIVVSEHYSMKQAERDTGVNHRLISRACRGGRKTAGGFVWSFA